MGLTGAEPSCTVVVCGSGGSGSGCTWAQATVAVPQRHAAAARRTQRKWLRAHPPFITPLSDHHAVRQRYCLRLAAKLASLMALANEAFIASDWNW